MTQNQKYSFFFLGTIFLTVIKFFLSFFLEVTFFFGGGGGGG